MSTTAQFCTCKMVKKYTNLTINMPLELEKDLKFAFGIGQWEGAAYELG